MSEETKRSIMETMFKINRLMRQEQGMRGESFNLTFTQIQALFVIFRNQPIKMSELADALAVTPASASLMVDKLADDGWLQRTSDKQDRRIVYLLTTDRGSKRLESIRKQRMAGIDRMLGKLSEHDLTELERILKTLLESMSQK